VISGVFTAEEVDGAGDKGSGYTTMFDVQTILEAFLKMSLICLFHLSLVKITTSHLWTTLKCKIII